MTTALVWTGVTVCCGGHRPVSNCLCCCECVTGAGASELTPARREALVRSERERRDALWAALRRAEYAVDLDGYWDLYRATVHAVRVLTPSFPHFEGSLT